MTAALRRRELARLCDAFDALPAEAPTCCEGWTAHDLAVHLWQLHHDPKAWVLEFVGGAAGERHRARQREGGDYADLVAELRMCTGPVACMLGDRFEGWRHAIGEYFVHRQDLIRANDLPPDEIDEPLAEALWLRAGVAARSLRAFPRGVILEHEDGRRQRIGFAPDRIVRGRPEELICWVYGRRADVEERRR